MHQHPRSPAVPSSAPSFPPRPTTRDDLRDQDSTPSSPTVDMGSNSARGLGIEPGSQPEQARNAAPAKEALARLNQIISVWCPQIAPRAYQNIWLIVNVVCRTTIPKPPSSSCSRELRSLLPSPRAPSHRESTAG
jgi:hypothetical protein